jgi:tripartite-type tricarboxylate transporter receptor subunit TctC
VIRSLVPLAAITSIGQSALTPPWKINCGSAGTAGVAHIATEPLNYMTCATMTRVPNKSAGPALNDLLGGQIPLLLDGAPRTIPYVKTNRLRGIAVTSTKRSKAAPDTSTVGKLVARIVILNSLFHEAAIYPAPTEASTARKIFQPPLSSKES